MPIKISESLENASDKAGLPPGTLVHVGKAPDTECRITVIKYDRQNYEEYYAQSIEELLTRKDDNAVTWVNIEGLGNTEIIKSIGQNFDVHPLVLEDILNTHQRQKFEDYDKYLFIVLKGLLFSAEHSTIIYEQISIVILNNFIFTFKEKQDDLFTSLKHRISNSKGRLRSFGTDYLAYAIIDAIVDQYMVIGDSMIDVIESIEDELLQNSTKKTLFSIQRTRRELIFIRKAVSPIREVLAEIQRCESEIIQDITKIYFRDVYDHSIRVIESMDSYRELVSGLLEIYLSSISNKMNEIMKVLTVFASIFIPLTFIAGIYGMNFDYMPELKWKWAYPILWCVFIITPIALLVYFKKKKWL